MYQLRRLTLRAQHSAQRYAPLPLWAEDKEQASEARSIEDNEQAGDAILASTSGRRRTSTSLLYRALLWIVAVSLVCWLFKALFVVSSPSKPPKPPAELRPLPTLVSEPPLHQPTIEKALVLASYRHQNTSWLPQIPEDWRLYRYVQDDVQAQFQVPRYQGREAMVYLTFIIDHYENPPLYTIFGHGDYKAWHQPMPFPMLLKAIDLNVLDEEDWVSLRCTQTPGCTPDWSQVFIKDEPKDHGWLYYFTRAVHNYTYRPTDSWYQEMPEMFGAPCCAQFAVTRKAIWSKPKEFWERLRNPLSRDVKEFRYWQGKANETMTMWHVVATYERLWHYFFGKPARHCPEEDICRRKFFQDKIHCNGTTSFWETSRDWPKIQCTLDEGKRHIPQVGEVGFRDSLLDPPPI